MSYRFSPQDFEGKIDSLYRLVIVASRRVGQIAKPDSRPLVPVHSKKPTVVALDEILQGKVKCEEEHTDEEDYFD